MALSNKELEQALEYVQANTTNFNPEYDAYINKNKFRNAKTWVPTYGSNGSMTYTSVTTTIAEYHQIGKLVFFQIHANGTTGGTAATGITFTLPVTPAASATYQIGGACWIVDSGERSGFVHWNNATSNMYVLKTNLAVWGLGASKWFNFQGFYKAA